MGPGDSELGSGGGCLFLSSQLTFFLSFPAPPSSPSSFLK